MYLYFVVKFVTTSDGTHYFLSSFSLLSCLGRRERTRGRRGNRHLGAVYRHGGEAAELRVGSRSAASAAALPPRDA